MQQIDEAQYDAKDGDPIKPSLETFVERNAKYVTTLQRWHANLSPIEGSFATFQKKEESSMKR